MRTHGLITVLTAGLLLLASGGVCAAAQLQDVRIWNGPESTRVVFDLSGDTDHQLFTLDDPMRVVVDVSGASRGEIRSVEGRGIVQRVRTGERDADTVRLVIDLAQTVRAKSFALAPNGRYGHRLVVDLEPLNAEPAVQPPAMTMSDKPIIIAVDAGHGGEDPGALGRRGTREKDVVLSIARKLAARINDQPNMRAVLIRDGDYYVGLRERITRARTAQADLFVSIHADAFNDHRAHGSSVYVLSSRGASSEHARALARRENESDLIGGVRLDDKDDVLASVLLDISQTAALEASFDAADRMLEEMGDINRLHKPTVQQANFMVLKAPDIPSVLVETAFISNPDEERRLRDEAYQDKLADRLMRGIAGYFTDYRPRTTVAGDPTPVETPEPEQSLRSQYTVRAGDTLSEIADRFSTPLASLRGANSLRGDTIRAGDVLSIPGG